ncbi:MAG: response regulator [Myxococcota bacterium]|nr:response regulator [Myxococcota bacterium]
MREAPTDLPRLLEGVRVLVVEDDPDTLELDLTALQQAGATVHGFSSAEQALAALEGSRFDVLVSDIGLPEIDGFELMRRVRALGGACASMPALAVTAFGEEEHVAEAARAGFHAHVRKPLAPSDLVVAIACLAPRSRA